jgi:hypothetical protein
LSKHYYLEKKKKKKKKKKKERKKERKRAPLDKNHDKQMNELLRIVLGFDIM